MTSHLQTTLSEAKVKVSQHNVVMFSPVPAPRAPPPVPAAPPAAGGYPTLSYDQISKAQKLCKFAISSLDYQDSKTAVENLNKALYLIQTGQELQ